MRRSVLLLSAVLCLASCELRSLYEEGVTPVDVLVCTDWSQLGGEPEGATILFYPETGDKPYMFRTNSVRRTVVSVPTGIYDVLVFNRTPEEYGTLSVADMNSLSRIRCVLDEKIASWLGRSEDAGRTVCEPEEMVTGRTDRFEVTKKVGVETDGRVSDSVMVRVERMMYQAVVTVRVKGIHNVRAVRSYITGMAGDILLSTRESADSVAAHVLESWTVTRDEDDYTEGVITASFRCLGLPDGPLHNVSLRDNVIYLKFLLVDNKTVLEFVLPVGSLVEQNEADFAFTVDVEDSGIVLPDVKPEGGEESGFDFDIEDWGEFQDYDVPV